MLPDMIPITIEHYVLTVVVFTAFGAWLGHALTRYVDMLREHKRERQRRRDAAPFVDYASLHLSDEDQRWAGIGPDVHTTQNDAMVAELEDEMREEMR